MSNHVSGAALGEVIDLAAQLITGQHRTYQPTKGSMSQGVTDLVATKERYATLDSGTYTQIKVQGRDYFVKTQRAGSAFVNVVCAGAPNEATVFKITRRSKSFLKSLEEGCAKSPTDGRFTFEQKVNKP